MSLTKASLLPVCGFPLPAPGLRQLVPEQASLFVRAVRAVHKPNDRLQCYVSWKEVIRKLKAAGFIEKRTGKGAHRLFVNPANGKEVWVTVHGHDAGRLGNRILRDAGVE